MTSKKVAIVTGGNTGIGRETALALAKHQIKVFITSRDVDKGRAAVAYIQDVYNSRVKYTRLRELPLVWNLLACPGADVQILQLDLVSLESVRKCAAEFKSRKLPLHILVNNAGMNFSKPWYTPEGVGGLAQVNFLGPYTFTRLLEEELSLGAPSRVVNVSSIMHRHSKIPDAEKFLRKLEAGLYNDCKLANVMFTHEAQRRWGGKGIQSSAVDPGAVYSDIWRSSILSKPPLSWVLKSSYAPTWDGAKPVIHAAIAPYEPPVKGSRPFRFFARGVFASPLVTYSYPEVLALPVKLGQLVGSLVDWPIRRLSQGLIFAQVREVSAARASYDHALASNMWHHAALAAGLDD